MAAKIGLNVRLLTGSTPKKERADIHRSLADGSLHILIGTHAVLEDPVGFNSLGLVVIDEQHRFGVAQRARLWNKKYVHTATRTGNDGNPDTTHIGDDRLW